MTTKSRRGSSTKLPRSEKAIVKPPKVPSRQPKLSKRRRPRKVGVDIAPEQPVELGAICIPEGEAAEKALLKLGQMYEKTVQAHRAYVEQKDKASKALKSWTDKRDEVLRELSIQTHESSMPILQEIDRQERDVRQMEDAAKNGGESLNPEPF